MAPTGAQSARQGTQKARMRAPAVGCVGCDTETPKGVPDGPSPTLLIADETPVIAMG